MPPVTLPDLRYEETFKTRLVLAARSAGRSADRPATAEVRTAEDSQTPQLEPAANIPFSVVARAIIVDQIALPFLQSFLMSGALFYLKPLLAATRVVGYKTGKTIVRALRTIFTSVFLLRGTTNTDVYIDAD